MGYTEVFKEQMVKRQLQDQDRSRGITLTALMRRIAERIARDPERMMSLMGIGTEIEKPLESQMPSKGR